MVVINIKDDFSIKTGFRTYDDGPKSGLEFYDKLLKRKYEEAVAKNVKLKIILDGGEGYTSSFLNEAFRLLGENYGSDKVWQRLIIISKEMPKYIKKIKNSVYEMEK